MMTQWSTSLSDDKLSQQYSERERNTLITNIFEDRCNILTKVWIVIFNGFLQTQSAVLNKMALNCVFSGRHFW